MKNKLIIVALALTSTLTTMPAYADNTAVQNELKQRPELSKFYQLFMSTGVNHELQENTSYTIFAPTNTAMAKLESEPYACFYRPECSVPAAQIIRNHIVPGKIDIENAATYRGGLFSISRRLVGVGEPSRNDYAVDGKNIIYASGFGSGMLYKIDGVIANPRELASIQPNYLPDTKSTVVSESTIPDPACGPAGCADVKTQTTTVTHTSIQNNLLAPAR